MIRVTADHKILIVGRGFTSARDLKPGDKIRGAGGTVTITKVNVCDGVVTAETNTADDPSPFEEDL